MMEEIKTGDVRLRKMMAYDVSHHVYVNNSSDMFKNSAGSFSCMLGLPENSSYSASLGPFHDSLNMSTTGYLPSGFVNKADVNNIFNEFDELGLAEDFQKMVIDDERKNLGSQEDYGFGFDGNTVNGNGQFSYDLVYDYGGFTTPNNEILGVGDPTGLCLNNGFANAMYPNASCNHNHYVDYPFEVIRRQQMRGIWGKDVEIQRPYTIVSPFLGYGFQGSEQFGMSSVDDLRNEVQNPINAPPLRDEFYSLEYSGMVDAHDSGVRNTLYAYPIMDAELGLDSAENLSRASCSVSSQPGGNASFGWGDDPSVQKMGVKYVADHKKGQNKISGRDNRLNKSRQKRAAFCSKAHQHEGTSESYSNQGKSSCQFGSRLESSNSVLKDLTYSLLLNEQNHIYLMAKDQQGCRLLQRMLDEGQSQDVQSIFKDIIHHVSELSMDPFGNYLVQKLMNVCGEEQITHIVNRVTKKPGELIKISKNIYGTRVVQKIIASSKTRPQISLVLKALEPGFLDLVKDLNGNHVLQQCLQCFCQEQNKFIFRGAARFCVEVATHRYGCCVLNQCIAHSSRHYREKLIAEIFANALHLAQDPFGNYVVQYIIDLETPFAAVALPSAFEGHFVNLSMQKFGSHVVEKCLKHFEDSRPKIIHELLSVQRLDQLLQHPFANYVIQSALQVTKGPLHTLLVQAVRPHKILRTSPYCKNIFSKNILKK